MLMRIEAWDRSVPRVILSLVAVAALALGLLTPWWSDGHSQSLKFGLRGVDTCHHSFAAGRECASFAWGELGDDARYRIFDTMRVGATDLALWIKVGHGVLGLGALAAILLIAAAGLELAGRRGRGPWAPHRLAVLVLAATLLAVTATVVVVPAGVWAQFDVGLGQIVTIVGIGLGLAAATQFWQAERAAAQRELPQARTVSAG